MQLHNKIGQKQGNQKPYSYCRQKAQKSALTKGTDNHPEEGGKKHGAL